MWGELGFKIDKDLCWSHPVVGGTWGSRLTRTYAGAIPSCGGNLGFKIDKGLMLAQS